MSAFSRVAAALLLGAVLALSAEAGKHDANYYPFYCGRGYSKTYYKKYYSGDCDKDFVAIQNYVSDPYYNECLSYEKDARVAILLCALSSQCFDISASPVCTSDGVQIENECFAYCLGYTSDEYTMGACSTDVTVVADPTPAPAPAPAPYDGEFEGDVVAVVDTTTSSSDPYTPAPCPDSPAPSPVSVAVDPYPSPCDGSVSVSTPTPAPYDPSTMTPPASTGSSTVTATGPAY